DRRVAPRVRYGQPPFRRPAAELHLMTGRARKEQMPPARLGGDRVLTRPASIAIRRPPDLKDRDPQDPMHQISRRAGRPTWRAPGAGGAQHKPPHAPPRAGGGQNGPSARPPPRAPAAPGDPLLPP